jgi:hypothetical protein
MATIQVSAPDLLEAVKQLGAEEFDAFLEQAMSLRSRPRMATLSVRESKLMKRINRALPEAFRRKYAELVRKRNSNTLTESEHKELLRLTHQSEMRDADRAAALLELAKLRRVPMRTLLKQLDIKPVAIDGKT